MTVNTHRGESESGVVLTTSPFWTGCAGIRGASTVGSYIAARSAVHNAAAQESLVEIPGLGLVWNALGGSILAKIPHSGGVCLRLAFPLEHVVVMAFAEGVTKPIESVGIAIHALAAGKGGQVPVVVLEIDSLTHPVGLQLLAEYAIGITAIIAFPGRFTGVSVEPSNLDLVVRGCGASGLHCVSVDTFVHFGRGIFCGTSLVEEVGKETLCRHAS